MSDNQNKYGQGIGQIVGGLIPGGLYQNLPYPILDRTKFLEDKLINNSSRILELEKENELIMEALEYIRKHPYEEKFHSLLAKLGIR